MEPQGSASDHEQFDDLGAPSVRLKPSSAEQAVFSRFQGLVSPQKEPEVVPRDAVEEADDLPDDELLEDEEQLDQEQQARGQFDGLTEAGLDAALQNLKLSVPPDATYEQKLQMLEDEAGQRWMEDGVGIISEVLVVSLKGLEALANSIDPDTLGYCMHDAHLPVEAALQPNGKLRIAALRVWLKYAARYMGKLNPLLELLLGTALIVMSHATGRYMARTMTPSMQADYEVYSEREARLHVSEDDRDDTMEVHVPRSSGGRGRPRKAGGGKKETVEVDLTV